MATMGAQPVSSAQVSIQPTMSSARSSTGTLHLQTTAQGQNLEPQAATVRPADLQHEALHFLGLPLDVREIVWRHIAAATQNSRNQLGRKPENVFIPLLLTCRQLYHELDGSFLRTFIPWNRLEKFLDNVPNAITIRQNKRLVLEIPQDAARKYIKFLSGFLMMSSPFLKELRLYFYGVDTYGTKIYSHGCGNLDDEKSEKKLLIDGQNFDKLLPLWLSILYLQKLEVLVISNANLQVYQSMALTQKPNLQYLNITSDPRSTIHQLHSQDLLGPLLIMPPVNQFPPVKVLTISANAALISVQVASKVMRTLRSLTWTVPDQSLTSGGMPIRWMDHTAELMQAIRRRGYRLTHLRICIGGAGIYEQEAYGDLIGSFREHLPHIDSLRSFEFHGQLKSPWFGRELLHAIPRRVTSIAVSDKVVRPNELFEFISEKVLPHTAMATATTPEASVLGTHHSSGRQSAAETSLPSALRGNLPANKEPWPIDSSTWNYSFCKLASRDSLGAWKYCAIMRHSDQNRDNYLDHDGHAIIGEILGRTDSIEFRSPIALIQLFYETDPTDHTIHQESLMTSSQTGMYISGRLDDRFRNAHLRWADAGAHIRPEVSREYEISHRDPTKDYEYEVLKVYEHDKETATKSADLGKAIHLYNLHLPEHEECRRDAGKLLAELMESPFTDDNAYFGQEDAAQVVFDREPVRRAEDLSSRPFYVAAPGTRIDGKCCWRLPDAMVAMVPSMAERQDEREGIVPRQLYGLPRKV